MTEQEQPVSAGEPPQEAPAAPTPRALDGHVATTARALAELDRTALSGHPEAYQRIHADLQGALADIDDA